MDRNNKFVCVYDTGKLNPECAPVARRSALVIAFFPDEAAKAFAAPAGRAPAKAIRPGGNNSSNFSAQQG